MRSRLLATTGIITVLAASAAPVAMASTSHHSADRSARTEHARLDVSRDRSGRDSSRDRSTLDNARSHDSRAVEVTSRG